MKTRVTAQSQPYRLRQRLEEARVGHGQEVRADLTGVRVSAVIRPFAALQHWVRPGTVPQVEGDVYFCAIGRICVREVLQTGDNRPLPETVVLDGLDVPESGSYDMFNALIQSNGDIRVVVDKETRVVPAMSPVVPVGSAYV
jgi:hypothetical protein